MIVEQACPYCGQMIAVDISEGMTEQERSDLAGKKCSCPEAARERCISEAMDKLMQLGGPDSRENGFDEPLTSDVMDACRKAAEWIVDGTCREVQLRCARGDLMRLSGAGTRVKIRRKCQKQMEL